ncbi:HAD-IA family hydrolase [Candidatus Dependentiae bacterium]|nr:HAD-IA family hydrolase [Candidatus Dependentiae bacterium]
MVGRIAFSNFKLDNIILSGIIGYTKPDPRAFEYMIITYKLDPHNCIFIDDQLENIKSAQACSMNGIHLKTICRFS